MRRFLLCASALVAVMCVSLVAQKVTTVEEYAKLMKANAQANGAMNKAIGSGMYADARMQVATLRTNYLALQGFWADKKQSDAIMIVKDGLVHIPVGGGIVADSEPEAEYEETLVKAQAMFAALGISRDDLKD